MSAKNKDILCKIANLAGENPDIYNAAKQICLEWSDKKYVTLLETYDYLKTKKPNEVDLFISGPAYMVRVRN